MTPGAAKHFDASLATIHQSLGIPAGKVDWAATPTHAHLNAPAAAEIVRALAWLPPTSRTETSS